MSNITSPAIDRALTVAEVAGSDRLNCTQNAVYRAIAAGDLKSFRIGRLIRVRESAVDAFIREQEG
mgnify:FL=1